MLTAKDRREYRSVL